MYHVSFPGLGINLDINNQIQIFGLSIYWYGLIIATGLILAVVYGCANSKRLGITADNLLNCVIVGVITGIIGARLYYVAFNWDYYGSHLDKIFAIHEGGLAIYGGIIGALIGGLIVAKISKMNIPALLDVAALGFLIGQGIGRWGNFFNQEAYGVATDLPWGMVSEGTNNIAVHPCFLYESVWCLLGFLLLHIFSRTKFRKYHGQIALIYLVWYGAERAIVEGLRTDSLFIAGTDIRVSQLLSILMVVAGLALLIYFYIKKFNNLDNNTNRLPKAENVEKVESTSQEDIIAEEISEDNQPDDSCKVEEVSKDTQPSLPDASAEEIDDTDETINSDLNELENEDTVDISSANDKEIDNILKDIENMKNK